MMKRLAIILGIIAFAFCYAPPPEPSFAQFGTQQLVTSTGSANAQSVALANYRLQIGVPINFIIGFGLTNTDVTTLNVNGTGTVPFRRITQIGIFEMVGGELGEGSVVSAIYDGTQYRQVGVPTVIVGQRIELRTTLLPQGYAYEDGSCFAAATPKYVALNIAIGSTYGVCSAGISRMPDSRGRVTAAEDGQGTNGSANQLTTGINGCNANIGTNCFSPFYNQSIAQMPVHTITGTNSPSALSLSSLANGVLNNQGVGGGANVTGGGATYTIGVLSGTAAAQAFNANPIGSGTNIFFFPPNSIVRSAIKL